MTGRAPEERFDPEEFAQEGVWLEGGGEFESRIEEGRGVWRTIHGSGFVNPGHEKRGVGDGELAEVLAGATEIFEAGFDIGSEGDAGRLNDFGFRISDLNAWRFGLCPIRCRGLVARGRLGERAHGI